MCLERSVILNKNVRKRKFCFFFLFLVGVLVFSNIVYSDSINNSRAFDDTREIFNEIVEENGTVKHVLKYDLDYFRPYYGSSSMLGQVVDFVVSKTGLG